MSLYTLGKPVSNLSLNFFVFFNSSIHMFSLICQRAIWMALCGLGSLSPTCVRVHGCECPCLATPQDPWNQSLNSLSSCCPFPRTLSWFMMPWSENSAHQFPKQAAWNVIYYSLHFLPYDVSRNIILNIVYIYSCFSITTALGKSVNIFNFHSCIGS